jgi:hypothetical protein
MTIHTTNNTAANVTIRRMTLPPQKNRVTLGNRAKAGQRNPWNRSPAKPTGKVQSFFSRKVPMQQTGQI